MKVWQTVVVQACLCLSLAGCGRSPQVTYHTLVPAQDEPDTAALPPLPCTLEVSPITIPEMYDRPQLVLRSGPQRVVILEFQRWAEPLRQEIRRMVSERLEALVPVAEIRSPQQKGLAADIVITLDIRKLDATLGGDVHLVAQLLLGKTGGGTWHTGRIDVREKAVKGGYDGIAAAHSGAVERLCQSLALEIRNLYNKGAVTCEQGKTLK